MYCSKKSHRVEAYPLCLSEITRFQAGCAEVVSSILEVALTTQLGNWNAASQTLNRVWAALIFSVYLNTATFSYLNLLILALT